MGFLRKLSTVKAPAVRAGTPGFFSDYWYTPEGFLLQSAQGIRMTPDLALTLSYVHCAVQTISDDFGTMSCQLFKNSNDQGRERVKYTEGSGVGSLAYKLRWQPNDRQSAKAFWSTLAWQYLLRPMACAELIYRKGSDSFVDQIVPRHPDRVEEEVLPSGRLRYKLTREPNGPRYLTQDEMLVVHNTSTIGLNAISRPQYGAKSLASAIGLQDYTHAYFKKGTTAALLATYKGGQMEDEDEARLHSSISRYVSGSENAGGILLVPEDIDVKSLGVDPEKAQLLGLKEYSGRDVARWFKMPPHKLFIGGTTTYASQVQSAADYVTGTQMPIVVEFEQAIQFSLIIQKLTYFAKFNMDYLLRADLKTRMEAYEIAIRSRVMRPSEARLREDMSPDEQLDRLSESDHRPGQRSSGSDAAPAPSDQRAKAPVRDVLMRHDAALRCVRRERVAVEKLAKKYPSDVDHWKAELKEFYENHASFVADVLRLPMPIARAFAAQHGTIIESKGVVEMSDHWERMEAEALTELSYDAERIAA
jgi:HK97 family phage portal protein